MHSSFRTALHGLAAIFAVTGALHAQGLIEPREQRVRACAPCPPRAQCIVPECPPVVQQGAQRISSTVRATLDGRIIKYEIDDRYVNRSGRVAEVDYVLPLPKGAAFENLELSINGEMIAGETMRADRARAVYEEIVRKMRDPALVEWMGHDLLRTRIFPIQPGEEKRVIVRFSAVAQREGDALRLDWPARAVAGARTDNDSFELRYTGSGSGETLGDAYSPTHRVTVNDGRSGQRNGLRTVRVTDAARAMTLLVPVKRDRSASLAFLPYAPAGEDGYALITLSPPAASGRTKPRDLTFVVDVSGSMSGAKIEQARAAGRQFLSSLGAADRFRIIAFSTDVRDFRDGWAPVTTETIRAATTFVNELRPAGGTNIDGALTTALAVAPARDHLALVLLLTDGAPTVGETRPEAIASHAADQRRDARVFTFGIGADVNAALLEQLALQGRGTATFVRPNESVERAVGVVADRLTSPVATDVTIRLGGARLYAMQPQGAIDLFAGQDLVVLARYSGSRNQTDSETLVIEGRGPEGPVQWTQRVRIPSRSTDNAFVARLWAVQRAGWLSAERRRTGGNPELDAELRELGERHGIPTELTSYLVVEPGMNTNTLADPRGAGAAAQPSAVARTDARGQVASAPAPERRFEAAKLSADQRDLKSLGEERRERVNDSELQMKTVGSRAFRADKDGVWTDTKKATATRTVKVKAYSEAYFTLLRELPELAQWFAVGDKVRVEGRAVTIELSPTDGVATLDATALAALKRDW
jgi:Ca-activated chloride channel family protein